MTRFFIIGLSLLLPLLAQGAITRGATTSSCTTSDSSQTSCNITHTVDSGTTLLILVVSVEALESVSATPTWNTSENFTLVNQTSAGPSNADVTNYVYALVSPTAKTDTVTVSVSTTDNISAFAINYLGTETASVAAATNALNEDVNNSTGETSTTVLSSGGTSGNTLLVTGVMKGGVADRSTNNASFTELFDQRTGIDATADHAYYVADKIGGAPSAVTITWGATDSNAGQLVEIVEGAGSVLFYVR